MSDKTREYMAVMQAYLDGKAIEYRGVEMYREYIPHWAPVKEPAWNFGACEYRIKPEPARVWGYIAPDGKVVAAWEDREGAKKAAEYCHKRYGHIYRFVEFVEVVKP